MALLLAMIAIPWYPDPAPSMEPPTRRLALHDGGRIVRSFGLHPDGRHIAIADHLGRVTLRRYDGGPDEGRTVRARGRAVAFSPDGRLLLVGGDEGDIITYDLNRGGRECPMGIPVGAVGRMMFSLDGRLLAITCLHSAEVLLWDVEEGKLRMILRCRSACVDMAFTPDGRSIACASFSDAVIRLWDLTTGRHRDLDADPAFCPISIAFSPDGRTLSAAGGTGEAVRLWDVREGSGLRPSIACPAPSCSVAFSPDGRFLAIAGADGHACLWDVSAGREARRFEARATPLIRIAFSPDGRTLAASGHDDVIWLWDVFVAGEDPRAATAQIDDHQPPRSPAVGRA